VGVEKLDLSENRPKRGEQKCIGDRRKSFIGHPDATHFRQKFCERVFQQPRDVSTVKCARLYYRLDKSIQPQPKAVNPGSKAVSQISSGEQD
jgi:hypothetical protein